MLLRGKLEKSENYQTTLVILIAIKIVIFSASAIEFAGHLVTHVGI